jgi:serine/threonine protein kinase
VGDAGGLNLGDVLGDFRIVGELGEGGMGVVYLAEDENLKRKVALKVIAPRLARSEEFRKRFIAEARSAAAIDHPNIVTVYSAGTVDGSLFIAMRYIVGTDLRAALAGGGGLDVGIAIEIVTEVAAALDAAHAAGMVHRDVKPGNILIEGEPGEGRSFLTDFGLTKGSEDAGTQLTGTGQWVGTIDYVAPEQIQGGRVDARTDVYALGCVLYEALSGRVPFSGNEMQKMWRHVNEPFPDLETAGFADRHEVDRVLERATAKDPADRFPSAGDLARAVTAALSGRHVEQDERSVAVGPAAEGLHESPAGAEMARTVTGRAPTPPRERATTKMPSPPAAVGVGSRRHSSSTRTAVAGGAVAIFCAGVIAAAIVISGDSSGSAASGTTVIRGEGTAATADQAGASSAGSAEVVDDWGGESAYSALLGAFSSEAGARKWQRRALARGLEAGVLYSSRYSSLSPGYWIVFSGRFASSEEADARAARARALDFPGSYAKEVSP